MLHDSLDLHILVEGLEKAEKLSCNAHILKKTFKGQENDLVLAFSIVFDKSRRILNHFAEFVASLYSQSKIIVSFNQKSILHESALDRVWKVLTSLIEELYRLIDSHFSFVMTCFCVV